MNETAADDDEAAADDEDPRAHALPDALGPEQFDFSGALRGELKALAADIEQYGPEVDTIGADQTSALEERDGRFGRRSGGAGECSRRAPALASRRPAGRESEAAQWQEQRQGQDEFFKEHHRAKGALHVQGVWGEAVDIGQVTTSAREQRAARVRRLCT